jgi:hypothetical protein
MKRDVQTSGGETHRIRDAVHACIGLPDLIKTKFHAFIANGL